MLCECILFSSSANISIINKLLVHNLKYIYILKCFLLYHAVPLGSIQELPAESCSEIKVSEGNEMVNRNYWIYSDGNGQTIEAYCEGTAC